MQLPILAAVLAALALVCNRSIAHQSLLQIHPDPLQSQDVSLQDTLLSALSSSDQHTIFIRLLQRAKAIPLLAHINATVFAPTDAAWEAWFAEHTPKGSHEYHNGWLSCQGSSQWLIDQEDSIATSVLDGQDEVRERQRLNNQNWALRQHILYHVLNYTLPQSHIVADSDHANITIETTLLFPLAEEPELPPTPPPGPPWVPRGGEGMLAGHGQRLRLAKAGSLAGGATGKIGVDHRGEGGATVWNGAGWQTHGNQTGQHGKERKFDGVRWVRNGAVVGIDAVLQPPPSIDEIIRTDPALTYLARLLSTSSSFPFPMPRSLRTSPNLTVFAPSDEAFDGVFEPVEKVYLEGNFGAEGVARILGGSIVACVHAGEVGWSDSWAEHTADVRAVSGLHLTIDTSSTGELAVNGTEASTTDVFASNGVVHIMPKLLLPDNFSLLNSAEKVLLSRNATRFVSLLRSANLSSAYISDEGDTEAWTILAPTDTVLAATGMWGHLPGFHPQTYATVGSLQLLADDGTQQDDHNLSPIAALLKYHILPGKVTPSDLRDGTLLPTELRTSSLGGARQRLAVDISDGVQVDNVGRGQIRFGGAAVLGSPVTSGKSIVYLISSLMSPPDDVLQTAVSDLQLSTFIAAVYAADLDRSVRKTPAVSYFLPRNRAFTALGLVMKYLLLPEGKDELRRVLKYHALKDLIYSADVEPGGHVYRTIEGGEVVLRRTKGDVASLTLSSPSKWAGHDSGHKLPSNGELRPARVTFDDTLTDTGVMHVIDSVIIPADVNITIGKLIRGSRYDTMADLMVRAGLDWVLEGRDPTAHDIASAGLHASVLPETDSTGSAYSDAYSLAKPSYTVLVPTDKAFSRLNMTRYINDKEALLELLKLHIIPTQPSLGAKSTSSFAAEPPRDGQPLVLGDDVVYSTLLSKDSKYGNLAFRATGDNSFIVGIRGARGNVGDISARLGQAGRATVRWRKRSQGDVDVMADAGREKSKGSEDTGLGDSISRLYRNGMTLGGGVMILDSVLLPYHPSWFSRWGWVVIASVGLGVALVFAAASAAWWWMARGKEEAYQPLEGEEEE